MPKHPVLTGPADWHDSANPHWWRIRALRIENRRLRFLAAFEAFLIACLLVVNSFLIQRRPVTMSDSELFALGLAPVRHYSTDPGGLS
jgi:hypothetical protein